tara:strand:- start:2110 stop:2361 length:252 start_codon:yes stop_codon:yes gene_type:complete
MTVVGQIKAMARRFIRERPLVEMVVIWDADAGILNVETTTGRGVDLSFPPDSYNDDGDPMTGAEKQAIADAVQAVIDEHNATL